MACVLPVMALAACDGDDSGDGGAPRDADTPEAVVGLDFVEIDIEGDFFTDIAWLPGRSDEILVASHPGEILHYRIEGERATLLGTMTVPEVAIMNDCGLLAVAPDPDWETNGFVYAGHCIMEDFATRVTRLTFDGTDYDVEGSASVILELHETRGRFPFNHNVSNILFEDDGTMVLGIGDKGAVEAVGQDPTSLAATILRIVPNREPGGSGYEPADGNPYTDPAVGAPEVWAYGFRYPWRIVRDPRGWYYVGDVGEGGREEVNVVLESATNYGWPVCQGVCDPPMDGLIDPITAWPHNDDHPYVEEDPETLPGPNRAVWIAPGPPPGSDHDLGDLLDDTVLFGDVCTGWVRGATIDDEGALVEDRLLGHLPYVTAWTWSPEGTGYVTTFGSCNSLEEIEPARLLRVVPRTE